MHFTVMIIDGNIEQQLAPFQENNMDDCPKEFLDSEHYGYKYNSNSEWDWWLLGGRWTGSIKLKPYATSGIKGEISLIMKDVKPGIDQAIKEDIANWDELTSYAFLKNGEWTSKNQYGYGEEADEKWQHDLEALKNSVDDDQLISIVDCHV